MDAPCQSWLRKPGIILTPCGMPSTVNTRDVFDLTGVYHKFNKMDGERGRSPFTFKKPLLPASVTKRAKATYIGQRGYSVTIRTKPRSASCRYFFSKSYKVAINCTDPSHLQALAWLAGDGVKKDINSLTPSKKTPGLRDGGLAVVPRRQCILPECRSRRLRKATAQKTGEKKPKRILEHGGLLKAMKKRLERTSYAEPTNMHVRVNPPARPGIGLSDQYARALGRWHGAMCENIPGYKDNEEKRSWYVSRDSEKCGAWRKCEECLRSDVPLTFTLEKSYYRWTLECAARAANTSSLDASGFRPVTIRS